MLENISTNNFGQAQIIDFLVWMDGGSVTVKLATVDDSELKIEFVQKLSTEISDTNPNPGRLLLNRNLVDIRSALETKIVSVLKNAVFSYAASGLDKDILADAITFIESEKYIELGNQRRT